ncbi:MAG: hypothetical protein ACH6QP_00275 [Candidatus Carsonella ruddii]
MNHLILKNMFLVNKFYKIFIGCEIHINCSINKIFSKNINDIYNIGYMCLLPVFNNKILNIIILISKILLSKCFFISIIERKNYFYYDLPKNYQLTQNNFQFLFNIIFINKCFKKIIIKKIHFEEDTASIKKNNKIIINYNRSGNSLIEIITEPIFNDIKCLLFFLKKIKKKISLYNISKLNIHLGDMRIDLNISIINLINKKKSKKIEIKNLNSFEFIKKSIEYEYYKQILNIEKNNKLYLQTRSYFNNYTFKLRKKCFSKNYNYIIDYDFGYLIFFDFEIIKKNKNNFLFKNFPNIFKNNSFFDRNNYISKNTFLYKIYKNLKKYKKNFIYFFFSKYFLKIKKKFLFNF